MKKLYTQPQTDFVRTASGEVIMAPIADNFGSGTGPTNTNAPARSGVNALKIGKLYI